VTVTRIRSFPPALINSIIVPRLILIRLMAHWEQEPSSHTVYGRQKVSQQCYLKLNAPKNRL
jgi:hypothetical protein